MSNDVIANDEKKLKDGKSKLSTKQVAVAAIVVILALVGVIATLLLRDNKETAEVIQEEGKRPVLITEDNASSVFDDIRIPTHQNSSYVASMSVVWTFPDAKGPSTDAFVENVPINSNPVYFDVELEGTGEVIYESPVIPQGGRLTDITLDKQLDSGSYACVITYYLVDDEQNVVSQVKMKLNIVVE